MTNLLSLISAGTMMIFLQTCGKSPKTQDTELVVEDTVQTAILPDTMSMAQDTLVIDSIGLTDGTDTTKANEAGVKPGKTEKVPKKDPVIKEKSPHTSPDQAKIDSLKKAKEKTKKKSDQQKEGEG